MEEQEKMQETVEERQVPKETVVQELRPAWRNFMEWWLLFVILAALTVFLCVRYATPYWTVLVSLLPLLVAYVKRMSIEVVIKREEVSMDQGLVSKRSVEIGMKEIRSIQVKQTMLQRILGVGDLLVDSSGTDEYEIIVGGIERPKEVRDTIQTLQREAQGRS